MTTQKGGIGNKMARVPKEVERINVELRKHSISTSDWPHQKLATELHQWADRFVKRFDLNIPTPAIAIDVARKQALATYLAGRDGYGVAHKITFNLYHLNRPLYQALRTLLHELLHEWQYIHGTPAKPPHHNKEFRDKAKELGLIIDEDGRTTHEPGAFTGMMDEHRVKFDPHGPPLIDPKLIPKKKPSPLRKWVCGCPVNVRVAIADFKATCDICKEHFKLEK